MKNLEYRRFGVKEIEAPYNGPYMQSTYFVTEETSYFKITKGYSYEGVLFDTEVIYKNKLGNPYIFYQQVDQTPGFYRRIDSEGRFTLKGFWTFRECMLHPGENLID